ncbi:MAG: DUF2000 domain-containing protein [Alphaproteobacteria bacterium]|nr:DUF2000 domain-containing protein [Alphaproteobacteria bacterium]
MDYEYGAKKVMAVLASTLEIGVAMNVLGHMAVAMGAYADKSLMGEPLLPDASGTVHSGIAKYPVIITKVKPARLRQFIEEARQEAELFLVDFPQEMLDTRHDNDLIASMKAKAEPDMAYLGAMAYGNNSTLQALAGKFMLWK